MPGGGCALLYATQGLDEVVAGNPDQKVGIELVRRALSAPARTIVNNAGMEGAVVIGRLLEEANGDQSCRPPRSPRKQGCFQRHSCVRSHLGIVSTGFAGVHQHMPAATQSGPGTQIERGGRHALRFKSMLSVRDRTCKSQDVHGIKSQSSV